MLRRLFRSLILEPPVDDDVDEFGRFQIQENASIMTPAGAFASTYPRSNSIRRREGKYAIMRPIDGHPDLHDYLWERAGADIPRECCWVIRGMASFANPDTNIIFATAAGAHDVRIRLSREHAESFSACDVNPSTDDFGFRWIHSQLRVDDDRAMLAMAFADSAVTPKKTEP